MNLQQIVKNAQKMAVDNSPAILTAIGVTGVLTTAYLTGKASFKAAELIRDADQYIVESDDRWRLIGNKEKIQLLWKLYIPAVGVGSFTIAAIIFANRIGTRRTAAMAAAYTISERAYSEYKEKVVETIGKGKEEKVRAEIAQDRVTRDNNPSQIIIAGSGDVTCKDSWSGREWPCNMEKIKKAQNDINYTVINHQYASLTDFYNKVGLEKTSESDDVGWNSDKLLEVTFTSAISNTDQPVLVMDFSVAPTRNFFRTH